MTNMELLRRVSTLLSVHRMLTHLQEDMKSLDMPEQEEELWQVQGRIEIELERLEIEY